MNGHTRRTLGLAAAFLGLTLGAATAEAQGKGKDHGKGHGKDAKELRTDDRDRDHDRDQGRVIPRDGREGYGNGSKVPPGLAKKPGQMPPGQYKKRYSTSEGSSILRDILIHRGYAVVRTQDAGDSRYVFYRSPDGRVRRAIVSPGTEQVVFEGLPTTLLREVISRLH